MDMLPVVIAHGFLAYRKVLFWEQFPGVEEAFRRQGVTTLRPVVHPVATIQERAEQLRDAINGELGTQQPFHIIAHSMGGLDARFLASQHGLDMGSRIRTVTTLCTPHRGALIAQKLPAFLPAVVQTGAGFLRPFTTDEENRRFFSGVSEEWQALEQLMPKYVNEEFNPLVDDHPNVAYFSYAGRINPGNSSLCGAIRKFTAGKLNKYEGENDGMVSIASAKWGEFKGVVDADHGEIIGLQIFPWAKRTFDHVAFFLSILRSLP